MYDLMRYNIVINRVAFVRPGFVGGAEYPVFADDYMVVAKRPVGPLVVAGDAFAGGRFHLDDDPPHFLRAPRS